MLKLVFSLYVVEMRYLRETPAAWVFCWEIVISDRYHSLRSHRSAGVLVIESFVIMPEAF
jgi:hypothetical protein